MTKAEAIQKVLDYIKDEYPDLDAPSHEDMKLLEALFDAASSWYSEEVRAEVEQPWRDFVKHILAMDALTHGGSNEAWAKRLLSGETYRARSLV